MARYIAFVLNALLLVSCTDDDQSPQKPQWKKLGLDGKSINEMELTSTTLYVATTTGLFKQPLNSATNKFSAIGFDGKNVEAVQILGEGEILVSIVDRAGTETPTLFRSSDDGQTWAPVNTNFGGETAEPVFDFEAHPTDKNVLYAGGFAVVAKSLDQGHTWEPIVGSWGGFATGVSVVEVNPYRTNEIWVGGQGPIENGFLLRSRNESDWDSWSDLVDNPTVVKEITFTDTNPNEVLVGFEGALLKTTNSGNSWETLIDSKEDNKFYFGIVRPPGNPNRVYTGGWLKTSDPQPLILLVSNNAGKTWEEFRFPDEAYGGILEMHLISGQDHDQLFLGLDKGGVYEVMIPVK